MASRNQSILFYSRLSAILLLVVLVLVNVAAARSSARMDLTEEGIYTLSDASQGVLASLQDPATIKVFWHNVPERGEMARRYVDSLLREMRTAAGGQLTVRWVDMEDPEGEKEAGEAGATPRQFSQAGEGELTLAKGFDSLVIEVGDESEIVAFLAQQGDRLEYEIITRLYKMTRVEELVVGVVTPQPAFNPFAGAQPGRFRALEMFMRELYGTGVRSHVSLDQPVPDDVDVLIVAGPKDLPETAVFHFEQYLLGGGRAILLLDPVHATLGQAPAAEPDSSGFEDWMAHLGLTVESGVVGDWARGAYLNRPRHFGGNLWTYRPYPYWLNLRAAYLDQENPAMRGFDGIPLYWPAAFSIDDMKQEATGRTLTILGTTSEAGYRRADLIGLDDAERDNVQREDVEPFIPLVVLLEGQADSFWAGRAAPGEEEAEPDDPDAPEDAEDPEDADAPDDEEEDAGPPRIDDGEVLLVITTDAELISDDAANLRGGYAFGFEFLFNLVDWMGGSDELLSLRARTRKARTIDDIESNQQKLIKWGHFSVIPLLALLVGVVVFIVRRYQR